MSAFITAPTDLDQNQSTLILWTASSMITVAVVSVFLRFVSRLATKVPILLDDWLILATLPVSVATSAITIWGCIYHHLGTHVLATATLDSLHNFLRGLYVFEITYALTIAGAKFSMMAIYWRIFPHPQLKWPLRATAAATGAWLIATTLVPIFSCNPVDGFWMFEEPSTCINSLAFYIGSAASNIAIDLAMLTMPIIMVARLRISLSQKIAVSAIFGLGLFVTACSCLRLNQLIIANQDGLYTDPTWNLVGSALWSDIETNASIVCACLPTMRPLLRLALHGTLKDRSRLSRTFSSRSSKFASPTTGRTSHNSKSRYHRFSDDRPLSGIEGDGEWLGKGVGAPGFIMKARAVEIEVKQSTATSPLSPLSPISPLPAAHTRTTEGRASIVSIRPMAPRRSVRRTMESVSPSQDNFILSPTRYVPPVPTAHHQKSPSAPTPTTSETFLWTDSRRVSYDGGAPPAEVRSSAATPIEAVSAARSRTLIRDPLTHRYVLQPPRSDERMSPDWEAGWEDELDRSVDRMWDPSRAASRAPSVSGDIYAWDAQHPPMDMPRQEAHHGWSRGVSMVSASDYERQPGHSSRSSSLSGWL